MNNNMNKLYELHLDIIENDNIKCTDLTCSMTGSTDTYATKSAEITEQIAVEFGKFLLWYTPVGDEYGNLILWKNVYTQEVKLTEQLFQEFLKQRR